MKVCGVDLDSKKVAMVVLDEKGKLVNFYYYLSEDSVLQNRLFALHDSFKLGLEKLKPDLVVIEDSFYLQNFITSKAISEVIGFCKLLCHQNGIKFKLVSNKTWKKSVLGSGKVTKEEIKAFVDERYPRLKSHPQDIADSCSIAMWGVANLSKIS